MKGEMRGKKAAGREMIMKLGWNKERETDHRKREDGDCGAQENEELGRR